MGSPLAGWLPVAGKEGRATLFSPRFLIIVGILALAVLAGTYSVLPGAGGGAGTPQHLAYGFEYFPDLNGSRASLALFVASLDGQPVSGLDVHLANSSGGPRFVTNVLETEVTDASGWVRFENLGEMYPDQELFLVLAEEPEDPLAYTYTGFHGSVLENRGQMYSHILALGGASRRVVSLVFMDVAGNLQADADVYIYRLDDDGGLPPPFDEPPPEGWEPYHNGTTDARGYYQRDEPLESGTYRLRVAKGPLNATTGFGFSSPSDPLSQGPDGVLAFSALLFLPLILPVMALVVAYDSVARERSEGSLDMLLSKPVSRVGVGIGKLAGTLASTAVPVVGVLLSGAALVWGVTGQSPSPVFLASFLGEALLLLLIYTVLFLAVSANVRNLGTALLVSILLFLLFGFFWSFVTFIVATMLTTPGSVAWYQMSLTLSLGSPSALYQMLVSISLSTTFFGGFLGGVGSADPLPLLWVGASAALWTVVPLLLFLLAMQYRVTEG